MVAHDGANLLPINANAPSEQLCSRANKNSCTRFLTTCGQSDLRRKVEVGKAARGGIRLSSRSRRTSPFPVQQFYDGGLVSRGPSQNFTIECPDCKGAHQTGKTNANGFRNG